MDEAQDKLLAEGMPPARIAEHVCGAVREERFYVLPHPELKSAMELRFKTILSGQNPGWL
jgi:hypothetical protein